MGHYPKACSRRAEEKELEMPFVLCPPEWWSTVARPAGVHMPKASEFSPGFPPESACWCQCISQVPQIPQWFKLKAGPSFLVSPRVLCVTAGLHMHPRGAGALRTSPMDGTLVNVNGQIVGWNEFRPFPRCFLAELLFLRLLLVTQSFVYFPSFLGMNWSFKPGFSDWDS